MNFRGHWNTLSPFFKHALAGANAKGAVHFRTPVSDSQLGTLSVSGRLRDVGGDELLVIIHGLGGSSQSFYMLRAEEAATRQPMSVLRLNMRGADERTPDWYHAGLTSDLTAVLSDPALRRFRTIYLMGYSIGGHVMLRYLSEMPDARIAAASAVCPPLDLFAGAQYFDLKMAPFYRWHVLRGLKRQYVACAEKRIDLPILAAEAKEISSIRDWDERVVAPRFGFESAEAYWRSMSVAPHLPRIRIPTTIVATKDDPMVRYEMIEKPLRQAWNVHHVALEGGGHVGELGRLGIASGQNGEEELIRWMRRFGR